MIVRKLKAANVTALGQLKAMVGNEAMLKETSNMIANKVRNNLTAPALKQLCEQASTASLGSCPPPSTTLM
eukprot:14467143-Ditylum_brightwellii.AAC.1